MTVFLRKEKIAKDTWIFYFLRDENFSYVSGQYVTVFFGEDSRDFTIASSPLEKDEFFFVTKQGRSAFKQKLFSLSAESKVSIKSPAGGFTLNENMKMPLVFLAGGIGITPFYSMITYAHAVGLKIQMTLIVSFSKKEDIIFYDELQKMERENPLIKIIYTLSRISPSLIKKLVKNPENVMYMIAGGEAMVENMENLLLDMGIDSSKIRIDIFTGY